MIERINRLNNIQGVNSNLRFPTQVTEPNMKRRLLILQYNAAVTGDSYYYRKIRDLKETMQYHQEILEKYPYDGKSTFAELLTKELEKQREDI